MDCESSRPGVFDKEAIIRLDNFCTPVGNRSWKAKLHLKLDGFARPDCFGMEQLTKVFNR
ncbi:hypothetical protein X801_07240 [Opisthorchis viverrini]|uniref:Uncharacterized protein n=1 Tax=Opisthorchis viverrini TaxID=6198 RepID=A0A1S8WR01_OPIVI|nr:hypothetical protein X801_07240 [Opisthorchis viverrini]